MKTTAFEDEKHSNKVLKIAIEIIKDRVQNFKTDRMNVAGLAKKCDVSRAWVYKNFGSSNEQIIQTAIDVLAPSLTAVIRPVEVWKKQTRAEWMMELMKSFELTLQQVDADPFLFEFYISHRLQPTVIGRHLAHHEQRFITHIVRRQVELSDNKLDVAQTTVMAEYLAALRIGLIFKWLSAKHLSLEEKAKELSVVARFIAGA